jgi:hypothetical protein
MTQDCVSGELARWAYGNALIFSICQTIDGIAQVVGIEVGVALRGPQVRVSS